MAKLHPLEDSMFPEIYETFLEHDDEYLSRSDWEQMFVNQGDSCLERRGWVLLDRNRIVGILGMLCSARCIQGEHKPFGNLHSWYVLPEHRGFSLFMLQKALADQQRTLIDFTPTASVAEISLRFGMKPLDSTLRLLPVWWTGRGSNFPASTITTNVEEIRASVAEPQQRLIDDHRSTACHHALVTTDDRQCHICFSRIDRWRIPYCYVHHVSEPEVFAVCHATVRRVLGQLTGTSFIATDARRFQHAPIPLSFRLPVGPRQLYRSLSVEPDQMDSMYSELPLLSLSTFPDLSSSLATLWQRLRTTATSTFKPMWPANGLGLFTQRRKIREQISGLRPGQVAQKLFRHERLDQDG